MGVRYCGGALRGGHACQALVCIVKERRGVRCHVHDLGQIATICIVELRVSTIRGRRFGNPLAAIHQEIGVSAGGIRDPCHDVVAVVVEGQSIAPAVFDLAQGATIPGRVKLQDSIHAADVTPVGAIAVLGDLVENSLLRLPRLRFFVIRILFQVAVPAREGDHGILRDALNQVRVPAIAESCRGQVPMIVEELQAHRRTDPGIEPERHVLHAHQEVHHIDKTDWESYL